mgnify:CR=1 FL=1
MIVQLLFVPNPLFPDFVQALPSYVQSWPPLALFPVPTYNRLPKTIRVSAVLLSFVPNPFWFTLVQLVPEPE